MEVLNPLLALAIVFGLLFAVVYRFGGWPRKQGQNAVGLTRSQSVRLTPQHSVHVVALGGKSWLLACHPAGVTRVAEIRNFEQDLAIASKAKAAAI
jgi:flagellar biogenesis protein FliO